MDISIFLPKMDTSIAFWLHWF